MKEISADYADERRLGFMEKLLDGVDVEWKTLGEIAQKIYSGGTPNTKKPEYWENGTVSWMSSGEVNLKIIQETEKFITEAGFKNSSAKIVPKNSIVMALAGQGKTRGKVARTRIELTTNQSLAAITFDESKVNPDYIFHFLDTQYDSLRQTSSGNSGRGGLNLKMISDYKIPIPCPNNPEKSLAIQAEIVRILDTFTELATEVTTELAARKKQYQYYRDQLLSFPRSRVGTQGDVEWKALGEIGEIIRGNGLQKKNLTETGFPAIHYGQIFTRYGLSASQTFTYITNEFADRLKIANKNDLLIATTSENDEDVLKPLAWLGNKTAISGDMMMFKHNQNVKYLAYCFQTDTFQRQKLKYITGAKVRRVSKANLAKLTVPIPCPNNPEKSLAIQAEIVRILDTFTELTTELTARKKQYEYYRDQLLNFPKPEEAA